MTGWFELRVDGPGRQHYRLYCLLDHDAMIAGQVRLALAAIDDQRMHLGLLGNGQLGVGREDRSCRIWVGLTCHRLSFQGSAFGIAAVLVCIGMAASFFLTKRDLARRDIPRGPIFTGAVFGLVGGFVVPVLGIFLGFALGLFLAELYRVRDAREAATSSWVALKSFGTGILVEFSCALLATGLLATSILTRFL